MSKPNWKANLLRELRGMADPVLHGYASAASRILQTGTGGHTEAEKAQASICLKLARAAMQERGTHLMVVREDTPPSQEHTIMILSETALRSLIPTQAPEDYAR
jgi:hypothetical protein